MARIYVTNTMGEAQVRVAVVARQGDADLCVFRVKSWGLATGDARWFITTDRQAANKHIFIAPERFSEVKICFVQDQSEAGWRDHASARRGLFS
jgi:hypothetical protein